MDLQCIYISTAFILCHHFRQLISRALELHEVNSRQWYPWLVFFFHLKQLAMLPVGIPVRDVVICVALGVSTGWPGHLQGKRVESVGL